MKINRIFPVFILATYAFGVRPQSPAAIEQGHQALKWLYEEAENGRFMYDLRRDYPNIQSSWPNFLANHGKAIVDQHYATLPRTSSAFMVLGLCTERSTQHASTCKNLTSHSADLERSFSAGTTYSRDNALSRQLLLDRITGQDKTNIEFVNFGPAPIDATKKLVESFAERRQAAAELSLARPGT